MFKGQQQCYQYKNFGCPLSDDLSQKLVVNFYSLPGPASEPTSFKGMFGKDFQLSKYVIQQKCITSKAFFMMNVDQGIKALKSEKLNIVRKTDLLVHVEHSLSQDGSLCNNLLRILSSHQPK